MCTLVPFVVSAVSCSWLLFRLGQCVGIGHALRDRSVSGAHGAHIARSKASHASAGSQTEFRRAGAAADPSTFRARSEQFAFRVARDTDNHPRHVVGDIERMFCLACLQGTIGGSLRLCFGCMDIQPSAIRGGVSAIFLQLELHGVRRLGRSGTRGRRGLRGVRLAASCQYKEQGNKNEVFHRNLIVNPRAVEGRLRKCRLYKPTSQSPCGDSRLGCPAKAKPSAPFHLDGILPLGCSTSTSQFFPVSFRIRSASAWRYGVPSGRRTSWNQTGGWCFT